MRDIPLTPVGGGGLCLSDVGMNPADIIVSTTHAATSGVIRADTGSSVSHAAGVGLPFCAACTKRPNVLQMRN